MGWLAPSGPEAYLRQLLLPTEAYLQLGQQQRSTLAAKSTISTTLNRHKSNCAISTTFPSAADWYDDYEKADPSFMGKCKKIVKCLLTFFFGVLDVEPRLVETLKKACPATTFCYLRWKLTNWDYFPSQPGGQGVRIRHWGTKDRKEVTMEKVQKGNILLLGGWIWIELKCLITWHCGV